MSCKLGGQPWAVEIPLKKTMVVGYDTYHDTVDKKKSVGALVATLNDSFTRLVLLGLLGFDIISSFTRFTSSCELHETGQEIAVSIKPAMMKALRRYKEEKVIMYR